jgi:alkylated DNA repair protein (DNA oxidative demethylase)
MNTSLFEMELPAPLSKDILGADTAVLAGFALDAEEGLLSSLKMSLNGRHFAIW